MAQTLVDAAVCNNKGNVRANNEDNFYMNGLYMDEKHTGQGGLFHVESRDDEQLYAVCDGMGGEEAGEEASLYAVKALKDYQEKASRLDSSPGLREMIQATSDGIWHQARQRNLHSGTTIAALFVCGGDIRCMHVGDSRVYRMRDGKLAAMTADHSEVQNMVAMGVLTKEEAQTHPRKNVINQYLGMPRDEELVSATVSERQGAVAGDKYLLCSDGLTDMVDEATIASLLEGTPSAAVAAQRLVNQALRSGGRDNVTAICVFVKKVGKRRVSGRRRRLAMARYILTACIACTCQAIAYTLYRILS